MIWGFLLAFHIWGAFMFLKICHDEGGGISLGEILLAALCGFMVPFILLALWMGENDYWPKQNPLSIKLFFKKKDSDQR